MHRILLKVAAHEMPSVDEISFLCEIKIEVLERFSGASMRVNLEMTCPRRRTTLPTSETFGRASLQDTKAPRKQGF